MRIKILKSIASIYGGFAPGMVVDIPNEAVVKSWCRAGIAEETKAELSAEARLVIPQKKAARLPKEKPEVIPEGLFWCEKHQTLHKQNSPTGKKCLRRIEAEQKKAEEAEEKAQQEAEAATAEAAEAEAKAKAEAEQKAESDNPGEPAE